MFYFATYVWMNNLNVKELFVGVVSGAFFLFLVLVFVLYLLRTCKSTRLPVKCVAVNSTYTMTEHWPLPRPGLPHAWASAAQAANTCPLCIPRAPEQLPKPVCFSAAALRMRRPFSVCALKLPALLSQISIKDQKILCLLEQRFQLCRICEALFTG